MRKAKIPGQTAHGEFDQADHIGYGAVYQGSDGAIFVTVTCLPVDCARIGF